MTRFRPCIDLHDGAVKQIVGGTLDAADGSQLRTNHVSPHGADYFAALYREHGLTGGHVIKLGPGNDDAARAALSAWPGAPPPGMAPPARLALIPYARSDGLQLGGGIDDTNAEAWIDAGAAKVIVTSWLFPSGAFSAERLRRLAERIGRDRLVVDLSCRRVAPSSTGAADADGDADASAPMWVVAMNKWQTLTSTALSEATLRGIADHCSEFLVHAADVEGLCRGIDAELAEALGRWTPIPCTYAGGANSVDDLARIDSLTAGRVDLTFGSALDIFGGSTVRFADCAAWNRRAAST